MDRQQLNDIINGILSETDIFSGFGVTIIVAILSFAGFLIKRIFFSKGKKETTTPETPFPFPRYLTPGAPALGKEFIHREDIIKELHKAIKQNRKLALINGLGGIGKTTVAKALYHKVKDEFKHIAWVEFQHNIEVSLLTSFRIYEDVEDNAIRYRNIKNFLLDATQDTIIFIDNVSNDDGLDFIKRLQANVILTSRLDDIGSFEIFPIDILSEKQCINIFYKYYKYDEARKQKEYVREIVNLVRCHTLSIELLARAANTPNYPLEKYVADLKAKGIVYPELEVETDHTDVSQTIAEHLKGLFELVLVSEKQKWILLNFALMPSIEIPAEVKHWLACDVNDINRLTKLGWLSASATGYEMHPIVKEAVLLQYKDEGIQYEDVETIVWYMMSKAYIKDTDIYTDVRVRLNIAESVMGHICNIEKEEIALLLNEIALLLNNITLVYNNQEDYLKAMEWFQKALKIYEKVLGVEHPSTATTYNNIALVYNNQEDYPKAMEWFQKALKIYEKMLGVEHPSTATTYNNIGLVYDNLGDYPKALEWNHKALIIHEKILGPEHPDTIITKKNIAAVKDLLK
ncbi:MAG: DUF2225 domain-containing protein [Defluviitaleaceae bacterium]|nr:DUF2225 domain-containing protein [Defluviitaleaceae bacterium]